MSMTVGTNSDIKEKLKLSRNVFGLLHKINYYFLFGSDSGLYFASYRINPVSTNPTKWSNTLKEFVGKLPTNCLSVLDHFAGLAFNGLNGSVRVFFVSRKVVLFHSVTLSIDYFVFTSRLF